LFLLCFFLLHHVFIAQNKRASTCEWFVMLSFNVQAAVALHDPVDESEYPPDTVVDAKDPLPIMWINT
jgi:hypothetical protein